MTAIRLFGAAGLARLLDRELPPSPLLEEAGDGGRLLRNDPETPRKAGRPADPARADRLHHRADLPGDELVVADAERLRL